MKNNSKRMFESYVDISTIETNFDTWSNPGHFSRILAKGPRLTTWIWNLHADAHDFDIQSKSLQEISRKIFSAHFGQLAIIFLWLGGMFFHGAYSSNYLNWLKMPNVVKPSAQYVWPIVNQNILNADVGGSFQGLQITSGLFNIWRAQGITTSYQLFSLAIGSLFMSLICLFAGWFHYHKKAPKLEWFQQTQSILNHHLSGLLGLGSLSWAGHQVHISNPINKLLDAGLSLDELPKPHELLLSREILSSIYPSFQYGLKNFFNLNWHTYSDFLTFKGGLNPKTGSLWLTDIAHHHLALAVLLIIAGHMYNTNFKIGQNFKIILESHKGPFVGRSKDGIFETLINSWHAQLAVNLACLGSITIIVAHHMYAMPPYPYLAIDYATQLSLFTHHMWIGGFLIVGAAAHASIFIIRDYDVKLNYNNLIDRTLSHRDLIISHLNWVCIFLGLHSFGLYIHNDTMQALGRPYDMFSDKAIALQPIFAKWIQNIHTTTINWSAPFVENPVSTIFGGDPVILNSKIGLKQMDLGTADFLVHHIHAFTIHVTTLILFKGFLYARNSRLIPDKANLGFRFPCDGPGRGGTCQISAWDHIFLGLFWMYNCISIVIFHFSWKMQSNIWGKITSQDTFSTVTSNNFETGAVTINGWLRDFLWAQAAQVVQAYGSPLSAYGLIFLGAHFIWAFSLMFLFSGRGYWQELIESLVWAHNKLKINVSIKPKALSITQGRAVGVAHFLLGGIGTTWAFFLARAISIN